MKRVKKLTRKERKEAKKIFEQLRTQQPTRKPYPQLDMFRASFVLQRQTEKKHEKLHLRQEKREFKETNKYKIKRAKELAIKTAKKHKKKSHDTHEQHQHEEGHHHVH